MTARFAILVAPSDPLASSAPARLEALGWLRNQLVPRGFRIAIGGTGANALAELEKLAAGVSPGDSVLVHVSGRLVSRDSIALNGTTSLSLAAVTDLVAARSPGYVSLVLDLLKDEDLALDPADLVAETAPALGTADLGYPALLSVRPIVDGADRIAFTRLAMPPLDDGGPPSTAALLAAMRDRAAAANESDPPDFMLLPGAPDETIDGLVAQASQARDWRRAVDLRLDRAETLATPALRAQELAGIARILEAELQDLDGAIDILEHARTLDPKRASILEALRHAYEASGRAAPIDPDEYARAYAVHRRGGHADAALLDAMLLEQVGAADAEQLALVEQSRTVGPMQVLKPLDAAAWDALRAPGYDEALAVLLATLGDAALGARHEQAKSSRRPPALDPARRLDPESTVSAVRTIGFAARVLGVECPDLYTGTDDGGDAITLVAGERPAMSLAPRVLSGTSTKQLAFLAGRALTWYRPEYACMRQYATSEDLGALVEASLEIAAPSNELSRTLARRLGPEERAAVADAAARYAARGGEASLGHWIRSADLTAARVGLFLCGELKIAAAGAQSQAPVPGRPSPERVTGDLVAFCASRAHAALRAQFLRLPGHG